MENTKFCQSCGDVPLTEDKFYGKNADGSKNEDYCCYCFPSGSFNKPDETLEEMVESMVPDYAGTEKYPDAESARKMLFERIRNLKR